MINIQNEPNPKTNAEPKAKSEFIPTSRERAGEPNFTHQNVETKRRSASGGQNKPNLNHRHTQYDIRNTRLFMQNEPNFESTTTSSLTSPNGSRVTGDE